MAIENAKTLNVRIKNKYDSYENWASSGIILEAGEIAVAYTTVNVDIGNGKIEQHPELLMKVGNGSSTFANLPWLSAKAADVPAWAKAANPPTYNAADITGISDYIADYVETEMGISVDTDTQYQIVKVNDYQYKLQSKGKGDGAWADVADSVIVIPNDTEAIEALEELVGGKGVATQISEAIAALDLANTYDKKGDAAQALVDAKAYTDTLANGAVADNTAAIAAINNAETGILKQAKDYADGLDTAMDTRVDALEAAIGAGGSVSAQITAEIQKLDKENAAQEGKYISSISEVDGVVTAGYSDLPDWTDEIAAAKSGAEATAAADATAKANAAQAAAEAKVTALEEGAVADNAAAIAALEELVGGKGVATQISTAVAAEAEIARAAEKANADAIDAIEKDYLKAADKTELQGNIDALANGAVKTNTDAIATLNANAETEGSVDYKIAQKFSTLMENPDEAMNSIQELVDWTTEHAADALEMSNQVTANKNAIATLNGDASTAGSVDKKIADAIAAENLSQYATDSELSTLAGRVTTVENDLNTETTGLKAKMAAAEADIDNLEELVGGTAVTTQISEAIEALKIGDYAKAADLTAAIAQHNTDKAALEAEIAKKANSADLAAIATTGSTDDLVQGSQVLVFDCGTSAV